MKVAQISPRYHPFLGGIETNVRKVSESLARNGIEVDVLTTDPTNRLAKEEKIDGVLVRRFKAWAPNEAYYYSSELASFLRRHFSDYDVVHAHSYHDFPALHAAQAKKRGSDSMFVFTPHYHGEGSTFLTNFLHMFYKPLFGQKIFDRADVVVCVSKYEKRLIEQKFPKTARQGKILSVPNGVDLEFENSIPTTQTPPPPTSPLRKKYVLFVGRLEPYKRVDRLVQALKYINGNSNDYDVSLFIVGKGPSKDKLVTIAGQLGVKDRVFFYENLGEAELAKMYRNASVLVNLSKFEAYGLSVAEALARGTPCVVANSTALRDWVDDKNCLGLDDPNDARSVARAIDSVIGKRVMNVRLPNWDEVAHRLIDVYERKLTPLEFEAGMSTLGGRRATKGREGSS